MKPGTIFLVAMFLTGTCLQIERAWRESLANSRTHESSIPEPAIHVIHNEIIPNVYMVPKFVYQHFPATITNGMNSKTRPCPSNVQNRIQPAINLAIFYASFLLLMQAGDLHPNPGPYQPKFPCVICEKAAKWNQRAVCCDKCDGWFHVSCMNMNTVVYDALANSSISWICCQCGMPNFSDSLFSKSDTQLSNQFSSLSITNESLADCSSLSDGPKSPPLATSSPRPPSGNRNGIRPNQRPKPSAKPKRSNLKVLVVNFQGIRGKIADLACCIDVNDPDVIIGTETHLNSTINSSELFPPNYQVIRKDRDFGTSQNAGGVLIAAKNDLIVTHRLDLDSKCEVVWVSISIQGMKQIIIGAFYRSQQFGKTTEYMDQLKESLSKIKRADRSQIWLAGDFNLPSIDWESLSIRPNAQYASQSKFMLELAADYGMEQMVTQPTRINNILDIFLTNNPTLVERSSLLPGLSDHDGIPLIIISSKPKIIKTKPRKVFLYSKADTKRIKEEFLNHSNALMNSNHTTRSVSDLWAEFESKVKSVMDSHIPSRVVRKRNLTPWIGRNIKRLLKKKQRAFNHMKNDTNQETLDRFHSLRKATQKSTRKAHRNFINSICLESSKKFWSYMKSLKTDSVGIHTLKLDGVLESDNLVKANILNEQFRSVFTQEKDTLPNLGPSNHPTMPDFQITLDGVTKLLKDLNPHKAPGPDGVPAQILKIAAEEIAPSLRLIFEKSLNSGELPLSWLCANISPIFKKGERTSANNYRPISLTAVCCKILEHILHSQIMSHFDKHSILTNRQHGFRRHHSCETQLILTSHDLALSLNNRSQTDLIIMDFTKAFDSVPHNRLLLKLNHYGVRNKAHAWIAKFLMHRKQRVVVGGEYSAWTDVQSGVPQGTVLGPLLFLTFINDLPQNLQSEVRLFADDCVLYRQINNQSDHYQLQADLDLLTEWQHTWQLHFNTKKCFVMRITHARNPKVFNYTLGDHPLEVTNCHPYLGVDLSNNFLWRNHINRITASANKQLGFIRRNLYSCTKEIKQTAYLALVRPLTEYASSVWDPYHKDLILKLEMIQRRAARFVSNDYRKTSSVTAMLQELDWVSLEDRRTANRICIFQKARLGLLPLPVDDLLLPIQRLSRHTHLNSYQVVAANKDCYKFSFWPRTIIDWNKLPYHISTIGNFNSFKTQVMNHLKKRD